MSAADERPGMRARDPEEPHRVSTPLELLFDLCFVVAIAQASGRLRAGLDAGEPVQALSGYAPVFFAIWWAWMNFTWFASAYDRDDALYRLTVLVQIGGALVLAAGVPRAFDGAFAVVTWGYTIFRVGLIAQWLRAARGDPPRRATALRYALGLVLVQCGWIALLYAPWPWGLGWLVLAPLELAVPMWAERAGQTPWHRHHIAERYGLLTLIVLGEAVLSATLAFQTALDATALSGPMVAAGLGGACLLFAMWWLYFDEPAHEELHSSGAAFRWGYGHLVLFAAAAAVGAGLAVSVDFAAGRSQLEPRAAGLALAVPTAIYVATLAGLHGRRFARRPELRLACAAAVPLILASSLLPAPPAGCAAVLAGLVALMVRGRGRRSARPGG